MALRVDDVQQLGPGGWSLRTPGWSHSFVHNALLVTGDPGPARILDWAEQAGAGLAHRHVSAYCRLSQDTLESLTANGFQVQDEILMARPTSAGPIRSRPGVEVLSVSADDPRVLALQERFWHEEWLPEADQSTVDELVGRRAEMDRAGSMASLVVLSGEQAVASIDVCIREHIAELDALATLSDHRGRGYGSALFARGLQLAEQAGTELVVLTALVHDWPWEWYSRLGFQTLGPTTEATIEAINPAAPPAPGKQ